MAVVPGARDRWGVPVQASTPEAVALFDQAVEGLVALAGSPLADATAAAEADGQLVLATVQRAYLSLYGGSAEGVARAAQLVREAGEPGRPLAAREGFHVAAARRWADGDRDGAARALEAALLANPRDLLALKVAQDLYFSVGDTPNLRDVVARVLPEWPEGEAGWGYVHGMYAFGLEENADYRRAEERAAAALAASAQDVWATHAMAHVYEMEGRHEEGIAFLTRSAPWWSPSYFAVHNWWHRSLLHLEVGQTAEVLALYDGPVRGPGSHEWLDLCDAASLLWRLSLFGIDVGDRAHLLAEDVSAQLGGPVYAFNDWHAVMALGLAGRHRETAQLLQAERGEAVGTNRATLDRAGLQLLAGFAAFAAGRAREAVDLLVDVRTRAQAVGGSHAQRDVIDLTLLAAAARAGDGPLVRALVAERVARKPSSAGAVARLVDANCPGAGAR